MVAFVVTDPSLLLVEGKALHHLRAGAGCGQLRLQVHIKDDTSALSTTLTTDLKNARALALIFGPCTSRKSNIERTPTGGWARLGGGREVGICRGTGS